jgi:hypothetical protein
MRFVALGALVFSAGCAAGSPAVGPIVEVPPAVQSAPTATASQVEETGKADVPERLASPNVVPSVAGTTWAVCSVFKNPATFTFLAGGGVSLGGAWSAFRSPCHDAVWSQNLDHVAFDCEMFTVSARIQGDRMVGWWQPTTAQKPSQSLCLQRIAGP